MVPVLPLLITATNAASTVLGRTSAACDHCALINNPGIILADEPTGNLGSANTAIIFDIFSQLADAGNTIIAVTHDHDFAAKSDRILQMADGRIIS